MIGIGGEEEGVIGKRVRGGGASAVDVWGECVGGGGMKGGCDGRGVGMLQCVI